MKIGVSTYCFWALIKTGSYSIFDAIEYAKKTGYDSIDFTELRTPSGNSEAEYAAEIRAACEKAKIEVCSYTVGADFFAEKSGDMTNQVSKLKSCVDTAKILGASMMRHDICWDLAAHAKNRPWQDLVAAVAEPVREIAEYAAGKGIKTMTENHGVILQTSTHLEALVRAVNHPNYGLLVDIGNFLCADEPGVKAIPKLMPYTFHIHAKDFLFKSGTEPLPDDSWFCTKERNYLRGTILGHGVVSVAQCCEIIKKLGYDGCVTLEYEGLEEPLDAISRGYKFLKARL